MADDTETEFRDLTELGELCGCTEKQTRLAEGLLAGLSQTEAAQRAGYAGARDSAQLRSAASQAAQTSPVKALLALAESRGLGTPNAPGDRQELRRILWAHARSKDRQTSIRATVELDRIEKEERGSRTGSSCGDVIREFLNFKHGTGIAAMLYLAAIEEHGPRMDVGAAVPYFRELAPSIKAQYPETWGRIRAGLDSDCQADIDKMAAAAPTPLEKLVKPFNWGDGESETTAVDEAPNAAG
jgi:hypothetical protein